MIRLRHEIAVQRQPSAASTNDDCMVPSKVSKGAVRPSFSAWEGHGEIKRLPARAVGKWTGTVLFPPLPSPRRERPYGRPTTMADSDKAQAERDGNGNIARVHTHDVPNESMSIGRYTATRLTTLKPAMLWAPNPFRLVRMLDAHHWAFFFIAFAAWVSCLLAPGAPAFNRRLTAPRHGMPLTSSPCL